ncbi:hypothetical protein M0R45_035198 [Rubus argutus]|uniref:MHC class I antigen n=1 Tax=Rubus argutus TaxID=59490 RepID=A0AAW1VW92_RUBAR
MLPPSSSLPSSLYATDGDAGRQRRREQGRKRTPGEVWIRAECTGITAGQLWRQVRGRMGWRRWRGLGYDAGRATGLGAELIGDDASKACCGDAGIVGEW